VGVEPESAPKQSRRDDPRPNPAYYSTKDDGQPERIEVRLSFGEEALESMDWKQSHGNVVSDASIGDSFSIVTRDSVLIYSFSHDKRC
jgi:hypothetical protein